MIIPLTVHINGDSVYLRWNVYNVQNEQFVILMKISENIA